MKYGEQEDYQIGDPVFVRGHSTQGRPSGPCIHYVTAKDENGYYNVSYPVGFGGIMGVTVSEMKLASQREEMRALLWSQYLFEEEIKTKPEIYLSRFNIREQLENLKELIKTKI